MAEHPFNKIIHTAAINKIELFFSGIFSLIITSGYFLNTIEDLDISSLSKKNTLAMFIGFVVIWLLFFIILLYIKKMSTKASKKNYKLFKKMSDNKFWLLTWAALFFIYASITLLNLGTLMPDSWSSLRQVLGLAPLSNAHPVLFTGFVSVFFNIGYTLGGINAGVFVFSFFQSAILATVFSYVITWMRKNRINNTIIIVSFLFYAFLPVNSFAGNNMLKDIPFSVVGLLLLMLIRELYVKKDFFFTKKNVGIFILLAFLFSILRHNGFYAYVLASILIILVSYKAFFKKKYLVLFCTPIFLVIIYSNILSLMLPSSTAPSNATLIIPMQQLARTAKYHFNTLAPEDKDSLTRLFSNNSSKINEIYSPGLSDVAGRSFNTKVYTDNKNKYISLWMKLFVEYPKTFIYATAYNTYGYFYPFRVSTTPTDLIINNCAADFSIQPCDDVAAMNRNKEALDTYRSLLVNIFPLQQNIGIYTCALILALYLSIIKRRKELIGVFLLLGSVLLSILAGPVNGDFRYLYLFVIAIPFVYASIFKPKQ